MSIFTNVVGAMVISSMLYTIYPQQLCINNKMQDEVQVKFGEKSIIKNLDYLKEDVKIPQLADGKDKEKIGFINSQISSDIIPRVEEAEKVSRDYFEDSGKVKPAFPYEVYSKYFITKDNNSIISFYNDFYEYLGGAHGITTRTSYTIDKKQEKLLTLKELFARGYDYTEVLNKEIKLEISKHPENYFDSGKVFTGINENQSFYIEDDNLVIYFQLYDIAPYVFGFPEFKIPLKLFDNNYIYK